MTHPNSPQEQAVAAFANALTALEGHSKPSVVLGALLTEIEPLLPRTLGQVQDGPGKEWFAQVWQEANHNTMPYNGSNLLRFAEAVYAKARQVPGWQLVPVKPDADMLGAEAVKDLVEQEIWCGTLKHAQERASELYDSMLKHAPFPPHPTPNVTVWFGSMPESNGNRNWTVNLVRKDVTGLHAFFSENCYTVERTEYYGRACYARDTLRFILGEISEQPCPSQYDPDIKEPPNDPNS